MMLGNSVWESTLQRHIPAESLSRVSAYDWFGSLAFYPLGLAVWGPMAAAVGLGASLWLAFALQLAIHVHADGIVGIIHLGLYRCRNDGSRKRKGYKNELDHANLRSEKRSAFNNSTVCAPG